MLHIALLLSGFALATEPGTQEDLLFGDIPVVTGASKYAQRVSDAPSSVTLITAEEIARFGWRDLAEILDAVRGLHVTNDRDYKYIGVRGFSPPGSYGERVLFLLDGFRLNETVFDSSTPDGVLPIDVADIDRIEIIRGPGSALYGTNAMLAVVNIITRRGRDLQTSELEIGGGSYNSVHGRATWGHRFASDWEVLTSVTARWTEGQDHYIPWFDRPLRNDGLAEGLDSERDVDALVKVAFRDLQLEFFGGDRKKEVPTAPWSTYFNGRPQYTRDAKAGLGATWEHRTETGTAYHLDSSVNVYDFAGEYPYNFGSPEDVRLVSNQDQATSVFWSLGGHVSQDLFDGNRLIAGTEVRHALIRSQFNGDLNQRGTVYLDRNDPGITAGAFVQDEWRLADPLMVQAGLRADYYPEFGLTVNPRAAAVGTIKDTALKLLYGTAYRAPNAYELFYEDARYQKSPEALGPERSNTAEVVVEQRFAERWSATAAGYRTLMADIIASKRDPGDGRQIFANVDRVRIQGVEVGAEGHETWLETRLSYARQDVRDAATDTELRNAPQHLGKILASPAVWPERVFVGAEVLMVDDRRGVGATIRGYTLVNAHINVRNLAEGLQLGFTVRNVLDSEINHVGGFEHRQPRILQDGRNFRGSLQYSF